MAKVRFSIQRLILLVAVAAGLAWIYRSASAYAFPIVLGYVAIVALLAVGPWYTARSDRKLAARTMVVSAALEFAILAYLGVFCLRYMAVVYKLMASLILMPLTIGAGVAWADLASAPGAARRRPWALAWAVVGFLIALPVSMIASHWPMWAAFYASRPALDRLADRLASGGKLDGPEWAGLFLVRKVSRFDFGPGNVALVVENDPTGHTLLIRAAMPEAVPVVDWSADPTLTLPPQEKYRVVPGGPWWHWERN